MKCPKCGYLGVDDPHRCRNCGYEFSLSDPADLPLFARHGDDDTPLITRPSPPRTPLAVRRSTPDVPRLRVTPRVPVLDLPLDVGRDITPERPDALEARTPPEPDRARIPASVLARGEDAAMSRRVAAVAVDSAILLAIDLAVVYFTMQICSVSASELELLPKVPLAMFLAAQNLGYLVAFTAGGQTLGKMAAGLRIVQAGSGASLGVSCAFKRTLASLLLAVPAGLGLLSACFTHDHRGLHDRFAGTRVVRASA